MATKNEMLKFYNENEDFKNYIDKCVKTYGKDVDHMLEQGITEQYYLSLQKNGCNYHEESH